MSDSAKKHITINPVAEGIVNRIAAGTVQSGNLTYQGGLWIEGKLSGDVVIDGPLVLDVGAELSGRIHVRGARACLLGRVTPPADGHSTDIVVDGIVQFGETLVAQANITAHAIDYYEGARIEGYFKAAPPGAATE